MRTDYSPFHVGQVKVTQANDSAFLGYGDHVPGGVWFYRGQVHSDSDVRWDAGVGTSGHLIVTYWWALSRKLREAPKPRKSNLEAAARRASDKVSTWPEWKRGGSAAAAKISSGATTAPNIPIDFVDRSSKTSSRKPAKTKPTKPEADLPEGFTSRK